MFNSTQQYSEWVRPVNKVNNTLWNVNDHFFENAELKFQRDNNPLIEATLEGWGHGTFEVVGRIPQGLVTFCDEFLSKLGLPESDFFGMDTVIHHVFNYLDYSEPYFLFVDSPVQLVQGGNIMYTYKNRRTGSTLDPSAVEVFRVASGWGFAPYVTVRDLLQSPQVQAVVSGQLVNHATENRPITVADILNMVAHTVYGIPSYLLDEVDSWLQNAVSEHEDSTVTPITPYAMERELCVWYATALAVMTWLKSPSALPFLIDVHPIYGVVLDVDLERDKIIIAKDSGGTAIVDGWDIVTLRTVEAIKVVPGTCECCRETLHCTKLVNVTALKHPYCGCGETLELEIQAPSRDRHYKQSCRTFQETYPPVHAFACQRCLAMAINKAPHYVKCGKSKCPAVDVCKHHLGAHARIRALTDARVKLLPSNH